MANGLVLVNRSPPGNVNVNVNVPDLDGLSSTFLG